MATNRNTKRLLRAALAAPAMLVALVPAPADAATRVTITAPVSVETGRTAHIQGVVSGPSAGAPVDLVKYLGGSWQVIQSSRVPNSRIYEFETSVERGENAFLVRVHAYRALKSGGTSKSVLVLGVDAEVPASAACPGDGATDGWTSAEAKCRILTDTNVFRASHGKTALAEVPAVNAVAQNWASRMAATGELGHNPDYGAELPSGWEQIGENIASGKTPDTVVAEWIASRGYRENLLGDYSGIGIGYAKASRTYYVLDFTDY